MAFPKVIQRLIDLNKVYSDCLDREVKVDTEVLLALDRIFKIELAIANGLGGVHDTSDIVIMLEDFTE
ncbi:MAG: hypothetical protein IKO41_21550 [Lachnospiraceae bacterium]|nr:hypothetical protein [Lachnospiraceae bacterium]